jgi:acetyl-CoA carboxylase biotin carboxyl carrier protein
MNERRDLLFEREGETTRLLSPGVGEFTCAIPPGGLLGPGQDAGVIIVTGRSYFLRVPDSISGRVRNPLPDRVHQPVGYRDVLYELTPVAADGESAAVGEEEETGTGLVLRATQTGRFYHRPSPDEPAFVEVGSVIGEGDVVGLVEVMKTFAHVTYRATGSMPKRAKVVRLVVGDGEEMRTGEPLIEVEAG